jgi:molybdate transport system substrate-binding protein
MTRSRLALFGLIAAMPVSSPASELKVLSAVGMRQVMLELGPAFERSIGHHLQIEFDATGLLAKRVASGEEVDVVLLNQSAVQTLVRDQHLIASSVTPIASGVAAVAIRKGAARPDISTPAAFKRMLLSAKSIARPSPSVGGSSGDHIARVLEQLGISREVDAKSVLVTTGHEGQVAESPGDAVAKGQAEIALHQLRN